LQTGGHWRRLYVQLLTLALVRLDQFLDAFDKAIFLLPSPFGNREARPYWTEWSLDRCALLALVYPLLSLFVVWLRTGESSPIAEWLGMQYAASYWSRCVSATPVVLIILAFWQAQRTTSWRCLLWRS
jgi:hypothetical protein